MCGLFLLPGVGAAIPAKRTVDGQQRLEQDDLNNGMAFRRTPHPPPSEEREPYRGNASAFVAAVGEQHPYG